MTTGSMNPRVDMSPPSQICGPNRSWPSDLNTGNQTVSLEGDGVNNRITLENRILYSNQRSKQNSIATLLSVRVNLPISGVKSGFSGEGQKPLILHKYNFFLLLQMCEHTNIFTRRQDELPTQSVAAGSLMLRHLVHRKSTHTDTITPNSSYHHHELKIETMYNNCHKAVTVLDDNSDNRKKKTNTWPKEVECKIIKK